MHDIEPALPTYALYCVRRSQLTGDWVVLSRFHAGGGVPVRTGMHQCPGTDTTALDDQGAWLLGEIQAAEIAAWMF